MLNSNRHQGSSTANRSTAAGVIGQNPMYGGYTNNARYQRSQHDQMYQPPHPTNGNGNSSMQALTESLARANLQAPSYHASTKLNAGLPTHSYDGGVSLGAGYQQPYLHNGQLMYASSHYGQQAMQHPNMAQGYNMYPGYMNASQYPYSQNMMAGHSPLSSGWAPSSRVPSIEVPSLVTPRRDSASSQEGDAPGTPLTHYTGHGEYQNGVAVVGRSPHGMYTNWSTPSPTASQYKQQHRASISPRLQLLVQQEPAIPHAIPAPYSPVKPLDRSLENPHGITNVYIRGLLPDTTDDKLLALASRFGDVKSHKSIIDHATAQCKGFGFVKFHNFKDAEDCIRGFHHLGYESSFARESFYSQLKKLHDDDNTNLYVSNLPKQYNEADLSAIFKPHSVCSSRILRTDSGHGRGVGFARFENRNVCDVIIRDFNNKPVTKAPDTEEYLIQIRFADTPEQKQLKQQTTAARQYRTAEYESVTQGRTPFLSPARLSNGSIPDLGQHGSQNRPGFEEYHQDFESYMKTQAGSARGPGHAGAIERLSTVSSHLSSPHGSMVNVKLPESQPASADRRVDASDVKTTDGDEAGRPHADHATVGNDNEAAGGKTAASNAI